MRLADALVELNHKVVTPVDGEVRLSLGAAEAVTRHLNKEWGDAITSLFKGQTEEDATE